MLAVKERWMDGERDAWTDGWRGGRISECMRTCVCEWVDSWVHRQEEGIGGWMSGWEKWIDGRVGEWMGGS